MQKKNCHKCYRFYIGTKLNKKQKVASAMFCKSLKFKNKGKFIWWGKFCDRLPLWCPEPNREESL